jgi:hypothetical protein
MISVLVLRKVVNFLLAAGWLWLFHSLGWITFIATMPLWQIILLTALAAWVVEWVFDFLWNLFVVFTCGLGCFLAPVVMFVQGWIFLAGAAQLTQWFTINVDFWFTGLLMSIIFGLIRIPSVSMTTSTSTSS